MFKDFKVKFQKAFADLIKDNTNLYITDLDKELLWETYLNSFEDLNVRQDKTCNCCKQFIRNYGNIVAIVDNKMVTIWDFEVTEEEFIKTKADMQSLVKGSTIKDIFVSDIKHLGTDKSTQRFEDKPSIIWDHLYLQLPKAMVISGSSSVESVMAVNRDNRNVFKRSLDEITIDAVETVLELISQNSLYKGEESKGLLDEFLKLQKEYVNVVDKDLYCWDKALKTSGAILKIRNTSIGTLLTDLSEGKELDFAVVSFEKKVAPTNYKRTSTIVSKRQVEEAEKTINDLGLTDSLDRRFATADDISINNLLFVNRDIKKSLGVFDEIKDDVIVNSKTLTKVEEVSVDTFIKDVLPTCKSIEVLFENTHLNNLVSLITAKNQEAPSLFKWNNLFSWSYTGAITDSLKERVAQLGGRVDGVFRFSHSWNEIEPNRSLMDLHVFMPGNEHNSNPTNIHDNYGSGRRVGWNNRTDHSSGGNQDVDYVQEAPIGYIPVENITFPNINKMPEGKYICKIHNWSFRTSGGRGKAEIEVGGNIYRYEYPKTKNKEWVTIAEVVLKNGEFTINHILPESNSSKEKWSLSTNKFQKVSMIMNSPNYWENNIGNRHLFFILEGCKTDEESRGFFNEFLKEDLLKQKRVFEILGGKMKIEPNDKQLSGLGFSSTQRNHVILKVEGKFKRLLKVVF